LIKRAHDSLSTRIYESFDRSEGGSLANKIEYVAKYGGEQTFTIDITKEGFFTGDIAWGWKLYPCVDETSNCGCTDIACASENNSIQFTILIKSSNVATDQGWIPSTCGSSPGLIGSNDPLVVCENAVSVGDNFQLTYKTWPRELDEDPANPNTRGNKYVLISPTGVTSSDGRSVRISRGDTLTKTVGGKTLFITEIKIFFI
jgi:hypothetical protein